MCVYRGLNKAPFLYATRSKLESQVCQVQSLSVQQQVEAVLAPALAQAGYELVQTRYVDAMRTLRLTIDHLEPRAAPGAPAAPDAGAEAASPAPEAGAGDAPASANAGNVQSQGGVSLEDCARASKVADAALESCAEHALFSHENLEVSSPGIERPLIKPAHFKRFVGEPIRLVLRSGTAPTQERKLQGTLVAADDAGIELAPRPPSALLPASTRIDYPQIDRATLVYEAFPPTPQKRGRGPKPRARSKE